MNNSFTWEPMGPLNSPYLTPDKIGGVYLLVFKGTPKRVIYVGQTGNFNRRIKEHQEAFLSGRRSIWRVMNNQDIYELMSHNGEEEPHKYYASLAKRYKRVLWATTDINKEEISNDLSKSDNFDENWREFVRDKYIKNIEVWVCRTPNEEYTRLRLESQIQNALRTHYSIGSHIHHPVDDMCFLGKVEFADKKFGVPYTFTNAPDISDEFTRLLHSKKLGKRYLKPAKALKQAEARVKKMKKEKQIKDARLTYKNAGKSWKLVDEIDFKKLVNSNIPLPKLVERFSRPPEEIVRRHEYLVKNHVNLTELKYEYKEK